jgi:hypothetical protein
MLVGWGEVSEVGWGEERWGGVSEVGWGEERWGGMKRGEVM